MNTWNNEVPSCAPGADRSCRDLWGRSAGTGWSWATEHRFIPCVPRRLNVTSLVPLHYCYPQGPIPRAFYYYAENTFELSAIFGQKRDSAQKCLGRELNDRALSALAAI